MEHEDDVKRIKEQIKYKVNKSKVNKCDLKSHVQEPFSVLDIPQLLNYFETPDEKKSFRKSSTKPSEEIKQGDNSETLTKTDKKLIPSLSEILNIIKLVRETFLWKPDRSADLRSNEKQLSNFSVEEKIALVKENSRKYSQKNNYDTSYYLSVLLKLKDYLQIFIRDDNVENPEISEIFSKLKCFIWRLSKNEELQAKKHTQNLVNTDMTSQSYQSSPALQSFNKIKLGPKRKKKTVSSDGLINGNKDQPASTNYLSTSPLKMLLKMNTKCSSTRRQNLPKLYARKDKFNTIFNIYGDLLNDYKEYYQPYVHKSTPSLEKLKTKHPHKAPAEDPIYHIEYFDNEDVLLYLLGNKLSPTIFPKRISARKHHKKSVRKSHSVSTTFNRNDVKSKNILKKSTKGGTKINKKVTFQLPETSSDQIKGYKNGKV
ncbi:unnamed protein product [Phyllotreta striolata]|uniref:Uncharacterized protein n=1 Tax=Phyllotreta striolata TaxID=444603 RepID=A0A9N9TJ15_PHYSR|nr:unnamed protein product [Phyllotreta striolata]